MVTIEKRSETQINLDRCTGEFILNLRAASKTMSDSFNRIERFREIALASCATIVACPLVLRFAEPYLKIEKGIQLFAKNYWREQKIIWNSTLGLRCSLPLFVHRSSFPDFPFQVISGSVNDLINPLEFIPHSTEFELSLGSQNLYSQAKVKRSNHHEWQVLWTQ